MTTQFGSSTQHHAHHAHQTQHHQQTNHRETNHRPTSSHAQPKHVGATRNKASHAQAVTHPHAPQRTQADIEARSQQVRAWALAELQPAIDFRSGRGVRQIYGGVSIGATSGPRLAVLLARRGRALDVELAPLGGRPGLYPLDIDVQVDGVRIGVVTLTAGGSTRARFPLPPGDSPAIEVRLSAPEWTVGSFSTFDVVETAAYRPLRLACDDG